MATSGLHVKSYLLFDFLVVNRTKCSFVAHLILFQDNGNITNPNSGKITIMVGVAKKKEDPTKKKGELMESNMDAMEVSPY